MGGRGTAPDYVGKFYHGTFPEGFHWGVVGSGLTGGTQYKEEVQLLKHLKVSTSKRLGNFLPHVLK